MLQDALNRISGNEKGRRNVNQKAYAEIKMHK